MSIYIDGGKKKKKNKVTAAGLNPATVLSHDKSNRYTTFTQPTSEVGFVFINHADTVS